MERLKKNFKSHLETKTQEKSAIRRDMMTISEVSKQFQISTRMLRYYEKTGLIESARVVDYAYRVYDEATIRRLKQIVVLRKLRIPVKQISIILNDENQMRTLSIMQEKLVELEEEISALATVRDILSVLVSRLDESVKKRVRLELLEDRELMEIVEVLHPPKTNLKEEQPMGNLLKADEVLESKMDIRIVYLPPATVASYRYVGENPEDTAQPMIYSFIKEKDLPGVKPDFRLYGFNSPSPQEGQREYGYEFWVTIPDDMEVKEPYVKKHFNGGLYAAHCIKMGDFHEWRTFIELLQKHEEYEIEWRAPEGMGGCMEEELNIYTNILEGTKIGADQLDLLVPIKRK